ADHRRMEVEVQLPTRQITDAEAVLCTLRDEDERSGGTRELAALQVHHVLAFENVERLGAVVMDVEGWTESRWLFGLEHGDHTTCFGSGCLDGHLEGAEIDDPAFTRAERERS